jgi:hypothetical protein
LLIVPLQSASYHKMKSCGSRRSRLTASSVVTASL